MIGLVRREPALAETALERLGGLLHYGLRLHRSEVDEVRLADEWAFVEGYLELEKLRLGDRLRLTLEAAPESLDCLVPPFALQPLVENAVNHAIAPRAGGGGSRFGRGARGSVCRSRSRTTAPGRRRRRSSAPTGWACGSCASGSRCSTTAPGGSPSRRPPEEGSTVRLDLPAVTAAAAGA